jgi:5'-methylthioadenosine phosphorylase
VTDVVSISAVGSLAEEMPPGTFVAVDQFIDRTVARPASFFGTGLVAHVSLAEPVCPRLSGLVADAARVAGAPVAEGATYLAMEGPQFSTRAESHLFRQWGAHIIGMTAMPEARLAREAELPYALIGMVTDYDCWKDDEAPVEVEAVMARMTANAAIARDLVERLARSLPAERTPSPIDTCLDMAIITPQEAWDAELSAKLDAILARRLASG